MYSSKNEGIQHSDKTPNDSLSSSITPLGLEGIQKISSPKPPQEIIARRLGEMAFIKSQDNNANMPLSGENSENNIIDQFNAFNQYMQTEMDRQHDAFYSSTGFTLAENLEQIHEARNHKVQEATFSASHQTLISEIIQKQEQSISSTADNTNFQSADTQNNGDRAGSSQIYDQHFWDNWTIDNYTGKIGTLEEVKNIWRTDISQKINTYSRCKDQLKQLRNLLQSRNQYSENILNGEDFIKKWDEAANSTNKRLRKAMDAIINDVKARESATKMKYAVEWNKDMI